MQKLMLVAVPSLRLTTVGRFAPHRWLGPRRRSLSLEKGLGTLGSAGDLYGLDWVQATPNRDEHLPHQNGYHSESSGPPVEATWEIAARTTGDGQATTPQSRGERGRRVVATLTARRCPGASFAKRTRTVSTSQEKVKLSATIMQRWMDHHQAHLDAQPDKAGTALLRQLRPFPVPRK